MVAVVDRPDVEILPTPNVKVCRLAVPAVSGLVAGHECPAYSTEHSRSVGCIGSLVLEADPVIGIGIGRCRVTRMKINTLLVTLVLGTAAACAPAPEPADLVITGGRIVTMDPDRPEAEALAARGQQLVAVGGADEVARYIGDGTQVIELGGALAVPGLIEGHGHFTGLGRSKLILDLTTAASFDEIVDMVAAAVAEVDDGEWIMGRGWHQEKWSATPEPNVSGLPTHDRLSEISPANPVVLVHASGHASLVNAAALEIAGIDDDTPDPDGGEIVRDAGGRAIGVLRETAEGLVAAHHAGEPDETTLRRMIELATQECLANGITSFHDAGSSFALVELLETMAEEGELGLRLWVMLSEDNETLAAALPGYRVHRVGGGYLTVGGIKRWVDGALGSHGAWLLEPYTDLPTSTGLNIVTVEELTETARLALEHDLQLCSHAIGDRANRQCSRHTAPLTGRGSPIGWERKGRGPAPMSGGTCSKPAR